MLQCTDLTVILQLVVLQDISQEENKLSQRIVTNLRRSITYYSLHNGHKGESPVSKP